MEDNYDNLLKEMKKLSLSRNKSKSIRLNNRLSIYKDYTNKELKKIEKSYIENEIFLTKQINNIRNKHKDLKYYVI
jgi:hypothetical protein